MKLDQHYVDPRLVVLYDNGGKERAKDRDTEASAAHDPSQLGVVQA